MIKEIVKQWESNKGYLKNYIKGLCYDDCNEYEKLVRILIKECLNHGEPDVIFDSSEIERIDHGDWQGTEIYLFHKKTYQPEIEDYYIFDNYYGSCSGCDTLMGIFAYTDNGSPINDKQADEIMMLLLQMVQRIECLGNLYKEENQ